MHGLAVDLNGRPASAVQPAVRRALMLGIATVAVGVSLKVTDAAQTVRAVVDSGAALAELLRFMAGVKAAMVLATFGVILWRMSLPVSFARFTLYAVCVSSMATGPGLIWGLVHVGLGALFLHAGLLGCLVLLWRDPQLVAHVSKRVSARCLERIGSGSALPRGASRMRGAQTLPAFEGPLTDGAAAAARAGAR